VRYKRAKGFFGIIALSSAHARSTVMVYNQSSAAQWGGGDRCPYIDAGPSRLALLPRDHPAIPSPSTGPAPDIATTSEPINHGHHHLPATSLVSPEPILYLPPLLSPLPGHVKHDIHSPSEEELSSFSTHLPDIDPASLALHQALHHFRPKDTHYAAKEYADAFNWDELRLDGAAEREWYCVVFRSRRNKESESLSLYQADRDAHEEAVKNGGLVMYWYGVPDETGLNLATCIWQR
jgi:hypothetical protein